MHPAITALTQSLSFGGNKKDEQELQSWDPVGGLARVYEVARNAMEYRAEHLVRRAAIERIIRRQLVFGSDADKLTEILKQELRMARYATDKDLTANSLEEIRKALDLQLKNLNECSVDRDWLLGLISAEIEDVINPNPDYQKFTTFAFNVFKTRIKMPEYENSDLVLYVAVDRTYALSDEAQVAYHLYKIAKSQALRTGETDERSIMEEVWKHYKQSSNNPLVNQMSVYIRRTMGPIVLIRDMYFANPLQFSEAIKDETLFKQMAGSVLSEQMAKLKKRMNTAAFRSLIYVFLTKMIFGLLLEVPAEKWISGQVSYFAIGLNALFPVVLMIYLTGRIKLPGWTAQERIVKESWKILNDFGNVPEEDLYMGTVRKWSDNKLAVFYALYALLFILMFYLVIWLLRLIHMGIFSSAVFLFFLSVVSFFAFRIRQTTLIYSFRPRVDRSSSWGDMLILPMVVVGGWLSREVSRLNFLVFIFDFILEAPLKTILRFLDSWSDFLNGKRDEVVG